MLINSPNFSTQTRPHNAAVGGSTTAAEPTRETWDQIISPAPGQEDLVDIGSRSGEAVPTTIQETREQVAKLGFHKIDPFVATIAASVGASQVKVPGRGESTVKVSLPQYFKKDVEVSLGTQNGPNAPMMVILPGIFGDGDGGHTTTFKKMALERGMNYLVIPNSLSKEALKDQPRNHPGNPRLDAITSYETIAQLKSQNPGLFKNVSVAGYSYGALHGANLVRYEEELMDQRPGMKRLITGSLVSVSPPENLANSMLELDGLREKYKTGAGSIIGTGLKYKSQVKRLGYENFLQGDLSRRGPGQNITEIKLSDKYGSRDDMKKMVDRVDYDFGQKNLPTNKPEFWNGTDYQRQEWLRETSEILDGMTYAQFSNDYMAKDAWLGQRGLTPDQMGYEYRFSKAMDIIDDTPVMVLASADDYILNDANVRTLKQLQAKPGPLEAVKIFEHGGHVGLTWNPEVQNAMADFAFAAPKS